ncbi:hypothetical protein PISMIDRAFT_49044, partial [Pisolithus microcarpus 441]
TFALPPFDHVKADVILRSSDGVDFRVFRLFLSLASPFFETLFDLPQPSQAANADMEIKDGPPVIPVSEGSKTLDSLVRFCYPCTLAEDPVIEDFREIISVLDAAKKYSLDVIQSAVCKSLFIPKILEVNPLRCFAIACRDRMQDECTLAAKYTLREPLIPEWFEEIELITSAELLSLLTYHQECSKAVVALKDDLSWVFPDVNLDHDYPCEGGRRRTTSNRGDWCRGFIDSTFVDLLDRPCAETIRTNVEKAIQTVQQRQCTVCRQVVPSCLRELATVFTNKLEEAIAPV